jgi:hypothetical protein
MMNKNFVIGAALVWSIGFAWPSASDVQPGLSQAGQSVVESRQIKSYTLKHIKPERFLQAAKLFYEDATFVDQTITVKIWNSRIPEFEALLKKLDVERKTVQFQVFAVIASRKPVNEQSLGGATETPPAAMGDIPVAGDAVTLKLKDGKLRDVVLYLANVARLNVVFDAAVQGVVTCDLKDIPWKKALEIVLAQNRMDMAIEGNVLWIAPAGRLGDIRSSARRTSLENKDLKNVLDELNTLWNFTSYEVDGPSFLTIREDSGSNSYKLVTNRPLNLLVSNVRVSGEEAGKRTISIEQLKLSGMANFVDYVYLDTREVTLKEKGYLVAGVSGYGSSSERALILVINGEIR